MRKSKKKLLAMLLAGAMVFGTLPSDAFANNEQDQTSVIVDENVTTDDSANMENENAVEAVTEDETPATEETTEAKTQAEAVSLEKTEEVIAGEKYVIVYDNKEALSVGKDQVIAVPVEVEGDTVETEITKNMVWTVDDNNNLVSELGKKLSSELTLQEDNGQSFKFNAKNVYYENGEVNTYLAYNEETSKWSFNTELNETVTYYRVIGPTESLSELTDQKVEEYIPSNEVTEEPKVEGDEVTEEPEVEDDEKVEEVNDEVTADLEEDVPTTFALGDVTYELDTDGVDSGEEYLIVAQSNNKYYALTNNNGSIASSEINISGNNVTNIYNASLWRITKIYDKFTVYDGSKYLSLSKNWWQASVNLVDDNTSLSISGNSGKYTISNNRVYLNYSNSNFTASTTSYSLQLYKKVVDDTLPEDSTKTDEKLYNDDIVDGGQYPQYPNEGAVRINKSATSTDFNGTGVAKVELDVTGVPVKKGVDVILLFDVSSSMDDAVSTSDSTTKLSAAKKAAQDFVDSVLGDNADGTKSNNRLALVTFAGWENEAGNEFLYGLKNAGSKDDIKTSISLINKTYSGTDYDYAFEMANEILKEADSNRDRYIVFMTDGAPSEYTGINGTRYVWSQNGTSNLVNGATKNLHKYAEEAKNSGAKIYSIGFGLTNAATDSNNGFTPEQAKTVLQNMSSGNNYYISADSKSEIDSAFSSIAMQIRKAGTEAVVTDKLGSAFNLQMNTTIPNNADKGETTKPLGFTPTIEVLEYDLWTKYDYQNKLCDYDQIGVRKSTIGTPIEIVTLNDDGTATSTLKSGNIKDSNGNILAEKFTYYAIDTTLENGKKIEAETFEWKIGDITQKEIAFSYYVYLDGSMEGNRGDGLYDTNEFAKLNYKNYLDTDSEKTFEKPKMPWGAAQVTYEFYLVNEKGEPVNAQGTVIPFEYRIKIADPRSIKFNWNNGTTVTGEVVAKNLVPAGYDLHIEDAAYRVHAVSSGEGSYEILGTVDEGKQQSTKLIDGSYDTQFTYSSVAFGVVYAAKLIPDTIVLDYGKSVNIDVIKNDLTQNAKLHSITKKEEAILGGVLVGSGQDTDGVNFTSKIIENTNGRAEVINDNEVKYTPTKFMDSIDKFYYSAEVVTTDSNGSTTTFYQYQQLTVMPATTVYYEDNFAQGEENGSGIIFSGDWSEVGTSSEDNTQDNGTVYVDGHPYGYDTSYENDSTFSGGTSHVVVGTKNADTTATFSFKGTGFDLISRTDNNSTSIIIQVKDLENNEIIKSQKLNNYYASGVLYQIPVYTLTDLPYRNYEVKIIVGQSLENANFYLDAIRIYNPLGFGNEEANKQYGVDGELNAQIQEVRNILIDSNSFTAGGTTDTDKKFGIVFVDTNNSVNDISTYSAKGPNNEVYLAQGQSIAFKIVTNGDPRTVQLGIKSPNGASKVTIDGNMNQPIEKEINTATDMYYDITKTINFTSTRDSKEGIVVVTNSGTSDSIISITNLKITYDNSNQTSSIVSDMETVRYANMVNYIRSTIKSDDINNDGVVDILDLASVGNSNDQEVKLGVSYDIYKFDVNGDGLIDVNDLELFRETLTRY